MADSALLMSLDTQSQGAIAPYQSTVNTSTLGPAVVAFYQKLVNSLPWVPSNLPSIAQQVLNAGAFPRLRGFPLATEKRPAWLADPNRYQQWRQMITGPYKSIDLAFVTQNLALAKAESEAAAQNAAFWNNVALYSGEDALEKAWQDLQNALDTIRAQRNAALESVNVGATIIASHPNQVPANLVNQNIAVRAQLASLDNKARSALAPIPTATSAAGLSGLPIVVAGIALATVAAVAVSAWAIAAEFTSVQKMAAANAQDIIRWRDEQDRADFTAGRITGAELQERRQENIQAANSVVAAQGAAAVGSAVGAAGRGIGSGIAMALGGLTVFGVLALLVVRFAKPKKT